MSTIDTLTNRNEEFAVSRPAANSSLMPTLRTMIIGCVDPRVDPARVLGIEPGGAVVIRNVGGRVTPALLQELTMLGTISRVAGANIGGGFHLVVLHHTDCGITRLAGESAMLADYFGVGEGEVATKAVTDPYTSVAVDVAALRAVPSLPGDWTVSGLVYDLATGKVETVVAPGPLRVAGGAA